MGANSLENKHKQNFYSNLFKEDAVEYVIHCKTICCESESMHAEIVYLLASTGQGFFYGRTRG